MRTHCSGSPQQTYELGKLIGGALRGGDIVALFGELGSGKTMFAAGVCEGLGVRVRATSPTFTLINEYPAPFGIVAHIDLYRISSVAELQDLAIESYFHDACICLIEWAEHALQILPARYHFVKMSHGSSENDRNIEIRMSGEAVG